MMATCSLSIVWFKRDLRLAGAAKAARDALYALRKAADHKATAGRIAERDGHRRAGISMTGAKRGVKRRPSANTPLSLDL